IERLGERELGVDPLLDDAPRHVLGDQGVRQDEPVRVDELCVLAAEGLEHLGLGGVEVAVGGLQRRLEALGLRADALARDLHAVDHDLLVFQDVRAPHGDAGTGGDALDDDNCVSISACLAPRSGAWLATSRPLIMPFPSRWGPGAISRKAVLFPAWLGARRAPPRSP